MKINLHNAQIEKIQTMADRSIQIRIGLPEMNPQEMAELFSALNNDTHQVSFDAPEDNGKSPAQRLRGVLYRNWENDSEKIEDFEVYYRTKMEKIINHYKERLA